MSATKTPAKVRPSQSTTRRRPKAGTPSEAGKPAASMADLVAGPAAGQPATTTAPVPAEVAPTDTAATVATAATTEAPPPEPACAKAKVQKGRPHPSLLYIIESKGVHPGRFFRIKRWARYQVGMSVLHCRITEGLDHLDIGYYVKHGLMTLRPMDEAEKAAALERWEGKAVGSQPAVVAAEDAGAAG